MKNKINVLMISMCCGFTSSCAVGPMPGDKYGSTPPQLIIKKLEPKGDKFVGGFVWDHPRYFGPVPKEKQAEGKRMCESIKARKAIGYHPKAKSLNGTPIKDGGFLCLK